MFFVLSRGLERSNHADKPISKIVFDIILLNIKKQGNRNMTTKILSPLLTLIVAMSLSVTSANAKPLKKPSNGEIKRIIKRMLVKNKNPIFVGIDNYEESTRCENIHIKRIKLLKVGRATSNYYERSGSYIDSDFMVKFLISGSCTLTPAFRINSSEYNTHKYSRRKTKPVMPMDLKGRVPFRSNIPYETRIMTDSYGDWVAREALSANEKDRYYSKSTKKYLKNLFYKTQRSSIKKWKKQQTIAANKLSIDAQSGYNVIQFNRHYTKELDAKLRTQPKRAREAFYKAYWRLAPNHAKQDELIRVVSEQLRHQR